MTNLLQKILDGRTILLLRQRYFASAVLRQRMEILTPEKAADLGVPTMGVTEDWRLFVNPEFASRVSEQEMAGLLLHETLHLLLESWNRLADAKDQDRKIQAIEMAINSIVLDSGMKLPENGIFPETYGFPRGLTPEEYYSLLEEKEEEEKRNKKKKEQDGGKEEGDGTPFTKVIKAPSPSPNSSENAIGPDKPVSGIEADAVLSRVQGEIEASTNVSETIRKTLARKPKKIPWDALLRARIAGHLRPKSGFTSFERPDRDQWVSGSRIIHPGASRRGPKVLAIIDASGSMGITTPSGKRVVDIAIDVVSDLASRVGGTVDVVVGNVKVTWQGTISPRKGLEITPAGGTEMDQVITEVARARNLRDYSVAVMITDGYTSWPHKRDMQGVPLVVVLVASDQKVPDWMKVVKVEQ
jgi:predicted metal-dependent peptidase